jgi:hypothetical protein
MFINGIGNATDISNNIIASTESISTDGISGNNIHTDCEGYDYNTFYNVTNQITVNASDPVPGVNNATRNPLFTNLTVNDYTLQPASSEIKSGLDGNDRGGNFVWEVFYVNSASTPSIPYEIPSEGANKITTIKDYVELHSIPNVKIICINNGSDDIIDDSTETSTSHSWTNLTRLSVISSDTNVYQPTIRTNAETFIVLTGGVKLREFIDIKIIGLDGQLNPVLLAGETKSYYNIKIEDCYIETGVMVASAGVQIGGVNTIFKGNVVIGDARVLTQISNSNFNECIFKNNTFISKNSVGATFILRLTMLGNNSIFSDSIIQADSGIYYLGIDTFTARNTAYKNINIYL